MEKEHGVCVSYENHITFIFGGFSKMFLCLNDTITKRL